jgi:FG-GAP repeat/FlgD Ig-like domain
MKKLFPFALAACFALVLQAMAQTPKSLLTLKPPTPAAGDRFGTAVVAFGNDILVGAPGDDSLATDAGAVYLFEGGTGKLLRAFLNPTPAAGDSFGAAIAVAGSFVIIGAPGDDAFALNHGVAYVFDGNTGVVLDALRSPNDTANDRFGSSVAAGGNLIIVGAPFVDTQSPDAGAVYLFDLNTRQPLREIPLPENDDFAHFGTSVAVVGNGFAVGTPSDGDARIASFGSVYFYDDISDQQPLYIPNPFFQNSANLQDSLRATNNGFGQSVAALGNNILAGAPFNFNAPAAYLVDSANGNLIRAFPSPASGFDNRFGFLVVPVGGNFFVGAPFNLTQPPRTVAAYLFDGATGQLLRTFLEPNRLTDSLFGLAFAVAGNDTLIGAPGAANGAGVVYSFAPALTCTLKSLSPRDASAVCTDTIQVRALLKITGGVQPFNRTGLVNGTSAIFSGDTLFASIPLALGANAIIVNCTVTDSLGAQTACTDTMTITRFTELHNIVINEILYDPNYDDLGSERIELKNMGKDTTKLDGFALWIRREDLNTYWLFPNGVSIAPGGLLTLHWLKNGNDDEGNIFTGLPSGGSEDGADDFWGNNSTKAINMILGGAGNANDVPFAIALVQQIRREAVAEFREACRMVDFVQIGGSIPEIETLAAQTGLWNAGEFLNFIPEGHSDEFDTTAAPPILTTPSAFTDQPSPSIGFKNKLAPPPSQHLLLSEICVRPTLGEFVEIHNPTKTAVNLSNYYLTDNVNLKNNAYTLLVKGPGSLQMEDGEFLIKFPGGAQIGSGEYQTVAFKATDFRRRYGQSVNPTYEINNSDLKVPEMITLGLGAPPIGFADAEEAIVLLRWNGADDLVEDVDYVAWGAPFVNKTGLGIDGVDSDSVQSYYDNETPALQQRPVAGPAHALLKSWQRRPTPREFGELLAGGNGISGHDETSENLARAFKQAKPTPNRRAKGLDLEIVQKVVLDTLRSANGDGILNPGEDVRLRLRLKNNSPDSTGTLLSLLRSPSPLITIGPDSASAFTNIAPGAAVLSSDFYEFSVEQTLLPDSIEFALLVIDKEAGSADTTHLTFYLASASPLPNLNIVSSSFTADGSNLLVFATLDNTGNTDAVSMCAQINIPGVGASSRFIGNVDWEHCTATRPCVTGVACALGAPCVPLEEEKLAITIPMGNTLLNTSATLSGNLVIKSGLFSATLPLSLSVPFVSVTVKYPKSTVLVPGVRVDLIEQMTTDPFAQVVTSKTTDVHGRVEFASSLFDFSAANKSYRLQIFAPIGVATDLLEIDEEDYDDGANNCESRAQAMHPLADDILLGNVDQLNGFTTADCDALVEFIVARNDGVPVPPSAAFTGQWRVADQTTTANFLEVNLGQGNLLNPASRRFYSFNAVLLGDLNASWRPRTPPVYTVIDAVPPASCSVTSSPSSPRDLTSVEDDHKPASSLPATVELYPNYPNPLRSAEQVNAGTTIRFALPEPELVSVKIYNILGKLVKTLADQKYPAGLHSIAWYGESDGGERAVSGIYFVRLQAGSTAKVQRLVLLK